MFHLRLNSLRQTWGLQGRCRIQFRRRGSSMMPGRCQRVKATHPSQSSTSVLLPIPRTDSRSPAWVVPSTHRAAWTFSGATLHSSTLWERERCYCSCCVALLGCFIFYVWASGTQLPGFWGGTRPGPLLSLPPRKEHLKHRVHILVKCDASAVRLGVDAVEVGLCQLPEEVRRWVKDAMDANTSL